MISGRPPFHGENHIDLLRNIQQKAVRLPPDLRVSKECVKLLRVLLNRNPLSRANFNEFIEASNAFVALGCNGTASPTDLSSTSSNVGRLQQSQQFAKNLGPISEEEIHQSFSSNTTRNFIESTQEISGSQPQPLPAQSQQLNKPCMAVPTDSNPRPLVQHFSPLEPSPPGPKSTYPQQFNPPNLSISMNHDQRNLHQYSSNSLQRTGKSESSQNSDDSEFVMVERGTTTTPPSTAMRVDDRSQTKSPITMWKQSSNNRVVPHKIPVSSSNGMNAPSSPSSPRPNSTRFFSGRTILSSRNLIPPSLPFVNKGI